LEPLLEGLLESAGLKSLLRAGWVRVGVTQPEDVAAHSWGVAFLVLTLLPPELNRGLALSYAVIHDLPEVRAGDITPVDGVAAEEKAQREARAMDGLGAHLPAHVGALWHAYEAQADAEAQFVRQLDRLDMAIRALRHHRAGHPGMRDFVESARRVVAHPALRPLMERICAEVVDGKTALRSAAEGHPARRGGPGAP
jgi:putative hydrolase of HD superfamily